MSQEVTKAEHPSNNLLCPQCYGTGVAHPRAKSDTSFGRDKTLVCTYCYQAFDDAEFHADGKDAMTAQENIVKEHIRSSTIVKISQNILSAIFISMAGMCVLFAPVGREVPAEIIGVAFLLAGVGIAGIANFDIKLPFLKMKGSRRLPPLTHDTHKTSTKSKERIIRKS